MRFYNYINEEESIEDIIYLLSENCRPFLRDWKSRYHQEFLWSGRKKIRHFEKMQVRADRQPLDTPEEIHKFIDNWFHKKFNTKARSNSLFCSFDASKTRLYGKNHIIFPIGNYKLLSSNNITDIYNTLEEIFNDVIGTHMFRWDKVLLMNQKDKFLKLLISKLEDGNYKYNIYNDSEQMLVSKDYYIYYTEYINRIISLKHELLQIV